MSNRRAQDERIEGTPDGVNAITEIVDVPDAPTIGTATVGIGNVSVAFTPATTGGTASTYTAISSPGSFTGTSATSPITVSGLTAGTSYTFTVRGSNSTGTGPFSSASNSITAVDLENAYDALSDITVPSGGLSSITFAGIPSSYKHLQIRLFAKTNTAPNFYDTVVMRLNSDTASNYSYHFIEGYNSSISSQNATSMGFIQFYSIGGNANSSMFGAQIIDLLDYQNTNKFKTLRQLGGFDGNTAGGSLYFSSGLWRSTSAITSITFSNSQTFSQYSSFALYGVK